MMHRMEIELPRPCSFYENIYDFEVLLDKAACGTFKLNGKEFTLAAPTMLASRLAIFDDTIYRVSLNALTEASLRFYRSGHIRTFGLIDYFSILFLTRYEWGLAFAHSAANSIERASKDNAVYHFEAARKHSEMFSYGLAVHFSALLLGVPIDRFYFILASGTRPDFRTRVSRAELVAAGVGVGALAPSGALVELEVKSLQGWGSFRSAGKQGKLLLKNLSDKASGKPNVTHLCIGVALPGLSPTKRTKTRILIADPGDAVPLDNRQQGILLLEESLTLLLRHCLWSTLIEAIEWLRDLRQSGVASPIYSNRLPMSGESALTDHEAELYREVEEILKEDHYEIVMAQYDERQFEGRLVNDVLSRLGQLGRREMTRDEARERLRSDNLGNVWFSGVDIHWTQNFSRRDLNGMLSYGVKQRGGRDLSGRSAYCYFEVPMNDEWRSKIRDALSSALRREEW